MAKKKKKIIGEKVEEKVEEVNEMKEGVVMEKSEVKEEAKEAKKCVFCCCDLTKIRDVENGSEYECCGCGRGYCGL